MLAQSPKHRDRFRGVADQIVELSQVRVAMGVMNEGVIETMRLLHRSEPGVELLWVSNRSR